MIYLLLAICCSTSIAVLMRLSSDKVKANISMLAANYVVCAIIGAALAGFQLAPIQTDKFFLTAGFGVICGAFYMGGFVILQISTRKNGIVLSQLFMKLGLLVPIAMSILLFKEMPTWLQAVGFCVAIVAIVMINLKKGERTKGLTIGLILLLLFGGGGDVMAKIFDSFGNPMLEPQYLFYTFFAALILCIVLVVVKKERPGFVDLFFGAVIGVPNFFSAKFLVGAVSQLPGVVVYPTYSVGTILVVTLIGVLVFKERLLKLQWIALVGILIALVMLNV